jgi:hypothetical protein
MSVIVSAVDHYRRRARSRRAELFRSLIPIASSDSVLDLGSEDGSAFHALGVQARVTIADIDAEAVERGAELYGYEPAVLPESGPLPFSDSEFDVVYCSSVIEHVTGFDKNETWHVPGPEFEARGRETQERFAHEIQRICRRYFVQTPARSFPIESHTWLPIVGWLPHTAQAKLVGVTNRRWVKETIPDWRLLNAADLQQFFPDARMYRERSVGLVKSVIAVRAEVREE